MFLHKRVLTVVGRWVRLQYEDFEVDPKLRKRLELFLGDVYFDGYKSESDRIRRTATVQVT
jgi:hypothetical protein